MCRQVPPVPKVAGRLSDLISCAGFCTDGGSVFAFLRPTQKSHEISRGCTASPGISKWKEVRTNFQSLFRFRELQLRLFVSGIAGGVMKSRPQLLLDLGMWPLSSCDSSPAGLIFSASLASLVMSRTPAHVSHAAVAPFFTVLVLLTSVLRP